MTDANRVADLALVGMQAAYPEGEDLAGFGRRVYRGLPLDAHSAVDLAIEAEPGQSVLRALNDAGASGERLAIVSLSPGLAEVLSAGALGGPVDDASTVPNPLTAGLALAQGRLAAGQADAVVLVERQSGSHAASAVVVMLDQSATLRQKRIYAVIRGVSPIGTAPNGSPDGAALQAVLENARVRPEMVGLIVTGSLSAFTTPAPAAQAWRAAYRDAGEQTCALSGGPAGMLGLIKTAWCLYRRVIPGTPAWNGPLSPERWQTCAFYVPADSRAWFCNSRQKSRYAVFDMPAPGGGSAQILLQEETTNPPRPASTALKQEPFYLFPVAAQSIDQLVTRLIALQTRVRSGVDMAAAARQCYDRFLLEKDAASVRVGLLGHTPAELEREIGFAVAGIPLASEKNSDWQTPLGSYFTAQPLGETGSVAFVYPGAFNSYPGVGQDLFYLFPQLYDRLYAISSRMDELLNEKLLYPRSMAKLTPADLSEFEARLTADPMAMLISGSSLAVLYTFLLRDVFELHPAGAFGYSLGEISMLFAGDVWSAADEVSAALRASPLFHTRLAGPQDAVRAHWKIPTSAPVNAQAPLWENYLLMAAPEKVRAALTGEPRVYLTHINTPRQVVIGGDPAGCRRVIDALACGVLKAPFNYALHNAAISSEHETMLKLLSWPVNQSPGLTLYSAASCQPMQIDAQSTARQIADGLCTCLDYPRLIKKVYQDGARIFIELGAGSNCARWIDESLNGQPHAAFSINRKGVDDYASILRLLARLTCHRASINLSLLYN